MPPGALKRQLVKIGHALRRQQAFLWLKFAASATLLWLWMAAFADLLLRMDRPVRLVLWGIFLLIGGFALWRTEHIRRRKFSIQGIAARIEHVFPLLNNRLINFLQFSESPGNDLFKQAYIRAGFPNWNGIDVKKLRDNRAEMLGRAALGVAVAFLLIPMLTSGQAWRVALWRTVNPFTAMAPISKTHILAVEPGTLSVAAGAPLVLACRVNGSPGHRVLLDVHHADGSRITYNLGVVAQNGIDQEFTHPVARVKSPFDYRFRAGDAPSPLWYRITPRPPLALTSARIEESPPAYLDIPARTWNGMEESPAIHENAHLRLTIRANTPLDSVVVFFSDSTTNRLSAVDDARLAWSGSLPSTPSPMRIRARSSLEECELELSYDLIRDAPPVITIHAPSGTLRLGRDGKPAIDFSVKDERGLQKVVIEQIPSGGDLESPGDAIANWPLQNQTTFEYFWTAASNDFPKNSGIIILRVMAQDNRGENEGAIARSDPIRFIPFEAGKDPKEEDEDSNDKTLLVNLNQVIELQRTNIGQTKQALSDLEAADEPTWKALTDRQQKIRQVSRTLLNLPGKTLGSVAPRLRRLYLDEMLEAATQLNRLAREPLATLRPFAEQALSTQERILRQLMTSESTARRNQVETAMNDVADRLKEIIGQQEDVIDGTKTLIGANASVAGSALIDRQDGLASDTAGFIDTLERKGAFMATQDGEFSALLNRMAGQAKSSRIRESMLQSADFLDRGKPREALDHAGQALQNLRKLKVMLESVSASRKEDRIEAIRETLSATAEKMKKIRKIHQKALQSMDALREQGDFSKAEYDLMEEEYSELLETTKDALLEIPVDLHIFSELNAANDMVEDVFSVFEEIEQQAGSENLKPDDVNFQPFSKEDLEQFLIDMKEAEGFMADMEFWLPDKPDDQEITFEAFDQEEMPESGMAVGDLAAQAQDLIGDLLEEADDLEEAAEDSATNLGLSDLPFGHKVLEGEQTSHSAGGKSGNVRPDHKEQDGRSNLGREGMSSGETAAGSGTIQEGDQDIQARRTQDPTMDGQVYAEGEAQTKATGGGKLGSGKGDDYGMEGEGARRMDSTEAGSMQGMESLLARRAEKLAFQASLQNVRTHSLEKAAHHMRQAADAVAQGRPIREVAELRQQAAASLRRAATELGAGVGAEISGSASPDLVEGAIEGKTDSVPAAYKDLLSEYYRTLNENL